MKDDKTNLTELPERQVLVHNHTWPRGRLNANGFRAWLQSPAGYPEVCRCRWAPHCGEHYKMKIG